MKFGNCLNGRGFTLAVLVVSLAFVVVSAQVVSAQEPVVIVSGSDSAYNFDETGDPPQETYEEGSNPPLVIGQELGDGAVVAGGFAATLRGGEGYDTQRWRDDEFEYFMGSIFQWLTDGKSRGETTILWYEGYEVYHVQSMCNWLIGELENMGYTIEGDGTEPIADIDLGSYDVVIIPAFQLGEGGTGGDPTLLPQSDVDALKSYVEGGGGLMVADQSDYGGHHFSDVQNKILSGLGVGFRLQDDDLDDPGSNWEDSDYQPIANVNTDSAVGSMYENATGSTEVGFYSLCTLSLSAGPALEVGVTPVEDLGEPGETLTFEGSVTYKGSGEKTFSLSVSDNYDWELSLSKEELTLAQNETKKVDITVTVPEGLSEKKADWITFQAVGESAEASGRARAISMIPKKEPPYPIALGDEDYYSFSTASLLVEDPAVPIMVGMETGYCTDQKSRAPWPLLYGESEYPPAAAAALIGDGRVVVNGGGGTLRSSPSDWYSPLGSKVAPKIARWLIDWGDPRSHSWLFYWVEGAFHNAGNLSGWLDTLENSLSFNLDTMAGGAITSDLLADYDVFQITGTERSFTGDEIGALLSWIENGGSLFLSCQSDYQGHSNVTAANELLTELGSGIRVQDDQITDDVHWTQDGSHFPGVYLMDARKANSEFDIWWPAHDIDARVIPGIVEVEGGGKENFVVEVSNLGTDDTRVGIEVSPESEMENWTVTMESSEADVASGESAEITLTAQVPEVSELSRTDWSVEATDLNQDFVKASASFKILGKPGAGPTPGPDEEGLPWVLIGGIVVVVVVVAVAGYMVMKRG